MAQVADLGKEYGEDSGPTWGRPGASWEVGVLRKVVGALLWGGPYC